MKDHASARQARAAQRTGGVPISRSPAVTRATSKPAVALSNAETGTGPASVMTMPPEKSGEDEETQRSAPASPDAPTAHARSDAVRSGRPDTTSSRPQATIHVAAARAAPTVRAWTWAPRPSPSAGESA